MNQGLATLFNHVAHGQFGVGGGRAGGGCPWGRWSRYGFRAGGINAIGLGVVGRVGTGLGILGCGRIWCGG